MGFWAENPYGIDVPVNPEAAPSYMRKVSWPQFKSQFVYDGSPEWLRVFDYLGYWVVVGVYSLTMGSSLEPLFVCVVEYQVGALQRLEDGGP